VKLEKHQPWHAASEAWFRGGDLTKLLAEWNSGLFTTFHNFCVGLPAPRRVMER